MADRLLVDQIEAGGLDRAAAEDAADRVLVAMAQLLQAGRYVRLPGLGRLTSHERPAWVPGLRGKRAFLKRTVRLASPGVLSRGEPYEVIQ